MLFWKCEEGCKAVGIWYKTIALSTKVAYTMSYTVTNSELKYANVIELSHRVNR